MIPDLRPKSECGIVGTGYLIDPSKCSRCHFLDCRLDQNIWKNWQIQAPNLYLKSTRLTSVHQFSGETKRELSHALSSQAMDIHVASQCLSDRIFDSTGTETLNSTNDFFISHEYKASPKTQDYRTKAEALYRASFYNCNFVNKAISAIYK